MNKAQNAFLRRLRAGGRSNMYGAIPYLMETFSLDRDSAFRIVCDWVDQQATIDCGEGPGSVLNPVLRQGHRRRNSGS